MRTIHLKNTAHMGDLYLLMNFLRRAVVHNNYLLKPVSFIVYVGGQYLEEFTEYAIEGITLIDVSKMPQNKPGLGQWTYDTWIGGIDSFWDHPLSRQYEHFYQGWFNMLSIRLGISNPIGGTLQVLTNDQRILYRNIDGKYDKDMTVLLINSKPLSGQIEYNEEALLQMATQLEARGHVVQPTWPLAGFHRKSTWELGANRLYDIAKIALKARYCAGILTGPMHAALNSFSIQNVEEWLFIDRLTRYTFNENMHWAQTWEEAIRLSGNFPAASNQSYPYYEWPNQP